MIRSFDVQCPQDTHIPWWHKVETLSKPRRFEFTPGLNVLWGCNGSGKSTLLLAMARLMHCRQGGVSMVTQTSVEELFDRSPVGLDDGDMIKRMSAAMVFDHDGQGVRYCDPTATVGLDSGSFDYDFMMEGIANAMLKASSGQTTSVRLNSIIRSVVEKEPPPEIVRKVTADRANDVWAKRIDLAESFLKGSGDPGVPTILLDEPDRSLDMPTQRQLWWFLRAAGREVQLIVASHTIFAIELPDANYIELEPGYLAECSIAVGTSSIDKFRKSVPVLHRKPGKERAAKTRKAKP